MTSDNRAPAITTGSVIQKLIDENLDVSTDELVAVLGGNAAKLFSRANLKPQVDARRAELAAA